MFVGAQPTSNGRSASVSNVIIPIAITVPLLKKVFIRITGNEKYLRWLYQGGKHGPFAHLQAGQLRREARVTPCRGHFLQLAQAKYQQLTCAAGRSDPSRRPVNTADFFDAFAIDFGDGTPLLRLCRPGVRRWRGYLATQPLAARRAAHLCVTYNALLFLRRQLVNGSACWATTTCW